MTLPPPIAVRRPTLPAHGLRAPRAAVSAACLAAVLLITSACAGGGSLSPSGSQPHTTLTVFAAASLQAAFTELGAAFHAAHPDASVTFSFGGSDALAQQILAGAPADVFASANTRQMDVAVTGGRIAGASARTFAHNRLVVIVPKANPAHIQTLRDLARPGVTLVLAAAAVPAGQYALDFLTKASADPSFGASYETNVLKNVVSYETDVKAVLTKVALGEADAGIVYTTDAATRSDNVATVSIPDPLNSIASYPIAPVSGSSHAALAAQFVAATLDPAGQAILARYGFLAAANGPQYTPPA